MLRRGRLILFVITFIFIALLLNLSIIATQNPAESVAASQSKWTVVVNSTRGTIYDRHLTPLVNGESEYKAVCMPDTRLLTTLRESTTDSTFAAITNAMKSGVPIVAPLTSAVESQDHLLCFETTLRYGDRLIAPHIIGYCHDGEGVTGIELACDELLNRHSGQTKVTYEVGGDTQHLAGIKPRISDTVSQSIGGVILTLDHRIQTIVEETAQNRLSKGAIVVLQPHTGHILACASYPSYQPQAVYESLKQDDGALINRAFSLYDCGSVFKIVTSAAALEHGVPMDRVYECRGSINVAGTVFHCHDRDGHGWLNMTEALAQSCNAYFIQLAQEVGADTLYTTANAFGFDRKITLSDNLTTAKPLLPDRNSLDQPAALANLSFGQGYLMATPLHIAQIIATVVSGGRMPSARLIDGYMDANGQTERVAPSAPYTVITDDTASKLRNMLFTAVESGTGRGAMPKNGTAAGKTGTAETGQKADNQSHVVQSWFAGYFPAEDPQYIITVVAEDSNNTGEQATALFCEISNNLIEAMKTGEIK